MLSIIHNLYKRNSFVRESVFLNLRALRDSKVPFQYILFNDRGDIEIKDDVLEFLLYPEVEYIYSEKNYGHKMCSGGWVGAIPYIKGKYINNIGQDDVFTSVFYRTSYDYLEKHSDIHLVFSNCFKVKEDLTATGIGMSITGYMDYHDPLQAFVNWFGVEINHVTRANNNIMAPGAIYRISLHDQIGEPDLDTFRGAADFEYWARILFNEYKCHYLPEPTWLYRQSEYTAGREVVDGLINRGTEENPGWQQIHIGRIKEKYSKLWKEKHDFGEKI